MKRVKCYGKTETTTVDSSFKRKFFGSFDFRNSNEHNSFQEFQQESGSFTSVASTSDYTDIHSPELFASYTDFRDGSLLTYRRSSRKVRRKRKYCKFTGACKDYPPKKVVEPSISPSFIKLPPVFTSRKARKPIKKNITYKIPYKRYNSKSHNHKTSRRHSLNKHSLIPIQPSCSYFFENPSSVINTGKKERNKKGSVKKKRLINKDNDVATSYCCNMDMTPSFSPKQPNWSSINAHSLYIEMPEEKKKWVLSEEFYSNVYSFETEKASKEKEKMVLSNQENISGEIHVQSEGSNNSKHLALEKYKIQDELYTVRNDNSLKLSNNFNVNSSETVGSKLKVAKNISKNASLCKKSAAIIGNDLAIDQIHPEMADTDNPSTDDKGASNFCGMFSEKLNFNETIVVNKGENASKDKSVQIYKEAGVSKISNEDFLGSLHTNITASKAISENKDIFKRDKENECLFKKNTDCFYSSTPLTSPSTLTTKARDFGFARAFSPVSQKDQFTTSTPTQSSKLISDLFDFSFKHLKCPSTKMSSSLLSRGNKSHISFINKSHSYQNRREQSSLGESHFNLFKKELRSSVASTSTGSNFKSTLSKLLEFCGQTKIMPFSQVYDWSHTTVKKIGEGTYGEVFSLVQKKISSVIKVIPFSEDNGDNSMQSIETVLSEVTVSKCLSELRNNKNYKTRNFNKLKSVRLVKGYYPDQMLVAWDKYSDTKSTYNSRPDIFNEQQMFAVIELEYGGKDMTCFVLRNAAEGESIFKQIAISLAIAEEALLFEHRDLHLGNILVQRNSSKNISYVLGGKSFSIPTHGLVVTIIDFTLSRVFHEGCIFYNDIDDDDSLFNQSGDYQFEIYKETKLLLNNEWHKCLLYSNVLWLTYVCVKLLEYNYSRPSSKKHEESLKNIAQYQEKLRSCQNAYESISKCCICTSLPKKAPISAAKMSMRAKYVDRKSLQKSTLRRASSVA